MEEYVKILLTGHKGYIGAHLLAYLQDEGHEIETISGDLLYADEKIYYNKGYDYVIHLAALAGVRKSLESPEEYLHNNVETTRMMFRIASKQDSKNILYASSSNAKEWWVNPYASTKKINELDAKEYDIRSVGMRFHTVFPGRPDMLYQRLKRNDVSYINKNHTRDFIHIEDLMRAICTVMKKFNLVTDKGNHQVLDFGTGHTYSVYEVAKCRGFKGEYREDPTPHERQLTKADVEWLLQLGWSPKRNIMNENCDSK
jgi:nucleoside-diphosphate-sugar epimerase